MVMFIVHLTICEPRALVQINITPKFKENATTNNNQKEKNLFKRASENTGTFSRRVFRGGGVAAIENHLKLAALTFLEKLY